ncbi:hypothetical protein L2E82_22978 [Cichorium intybus]|uniref:Uncharacterized protein n=1 Tax=Cichorium intybus TaxID=13427 RepID=A0ACB9E087_CICIN|nr:hypothetical protein L2E82_22978 [Cichorium intybus]
MLKGVVFVKLPVVPANSIPDGWMGLDIGPDSIKSFSESLDTTQTVNGPMGVFEFEKLAVGTESITQAGLMSSHFRQSNIPL